MSTVSQQVRDSTGNLYPDIVNISRQLVGNGAPDPSLGSNGNVYTDALTGQQYQKVNGVWELTVDLPSGS